MATSPANNCLQIIVCSCALPDNIVLLQIVFRSCALLTYYIPPLLVLHFANMARFAELWENDMTCLLNEKNSESTKKATKVALKLFWQYINESKFEEVSWYHQKPSLQLCQGSSTLKPEKRMETFTAKLHWSEFDSGNNVCLVDIKWILLENPSEANAVCKIRVYWIVLSSLILLVESQSWQICQMQGSAYFALLYNSYK